MIELSHCFTEPVKTRSNVRLESDSMCTYLWRTAAILPIHRHLNKYVTILVGSSCQVSYATYAYYNTGV